MANEQRLIDANALLEKQYNSSPLKALHFVEMVVDVRDIEDAPTVDAVPVVHGKWIDTGESYVDEHCNHHYFECSECKYEISDRYGLYNYCPNCGAKMDGGNEDA